MGECYLYGQGGAGGNVKFATGTFSVTAPDSEDIQTVQIGTEFIPDYIVLYCIGQGTSGLNRLGNTMSISYERKSNSWIIIHKKGTWSDSGATYEYTADTWYVKINYDESTGTIKFTNGSGLVFSTTGTLFRWIMWKE